MINFADMGLNMSDLTNSIKIIILKREEMSYSIIQASLLELFNLFARLMKCQCSPTRQKALRTLGVPIEKLHICGYLSMNHTDDYFRYLKRLLKFFKILRPEAIERAVLQVVKAYVSRYRAPALQQQNH
jgi:hypothetical protein